MTRVLLALVFAVQTVATQTAIVPPPNKYSVADDVKMGQEAAAQVERQLPVMRDDELTSYVEEVGRRLVDAIPEDQDAATQRLIRRAIDESFVSGFRMVMAIGAALAMGAAVTAMTFIRGTK